MRGLIVGLLVLLMFSCTKESRFQRDVDGKWQIEEVSNWGIDQNEINEIDFFEKGKFHLQTTVFNDTSKYSIGSDVSYDLLTKKLTTYIRLNSNNKVLNDTYAIYKKSALELELIGENQLKLKRTE